MHGCLAIPFKISLDRMRVLRTYCKTEDSKATTLLMACDMHNKRCYFIPLFSIQNT